MNDESLKPGCLLHELEIIRSWINELEGSNRGDAFELMSQVMADELMNMEGAKLEKLKADRRVSERTTLFTLLAVSGRVMDAWLKQPDRRTNNIQALFLGVINGDRQEINSAY